MEQLMGDIVVRLIHKWELQSRRRESISISQELLLLDNKVALFNNYSNI